MGGLCRRVGPIANAADCRSPLPPPRPPRTHTHTSLDMPPCLPPAAAPFWLHTMAAPGLMSCCALCLRPPCPGGSPTP
jgi:hypothetical protein